VRVERRVRQDTEPLPWAALVDDELVQAASREEAEALGGVLMRRGSGGRTLWPDGTEDWQQTYFGFV
jgi:hypothetical protein